MAKLSLSRAWDDTRGILAADGKLIGAVALALFFLPGVLAAVVQPEADGMPSTTGGLALMAAVAVIGVIGQLAVIRLALGMRNTVGETIRHSVMRAPAYIAASLLWLLPLLIAGYFLAADALKSPETASLASALGLIALVVVMLFLSVRMLMSSSVATAEASSPIDILRRSWRLTSGNWWRLFAFLLTFLLIALVSLWATGALVGIVAGLVFGAVEPMSVGALFIAFFVQLVTAVITVGFLVMLARMYVQLSGPAHADVSVPSSGT